MKDKCVSVGMAILVFSCSTANTTDTGSNGGAGGHSPFATGGTAANAGDASSSGGMTPIANSSTGPPPTWTELYDNYFGPGTAGNCVSCHGNGTSSPAFDSAETLCAVLKSRGYIVHTVAGLEYLIEWFGLGGTMPQGGGAPPPGAVNDIMAWENAQAICP